ncbi:MAG: hypothetical protein VX768_02660 [Planctomycetota bacterium]|nr:hypothetical protein [Planctomycetota bacterium]
MKRLLLFFLVLLIARNAASQQPAVDSILDRFDTNQDGFLNEKEVQSSTRYSRQFPRWDTDRDGKVNRGDIIRFRAKFGIAADGSRIPSGGGSRGTAGSSNGLVIPDISKLIRADQKTPVPAHLASQSQYIVKTTPHAVSGKRYLVLTDHQQEEYLRPLQRLAKHHNGKVLQVESLALLQQDPKFRFQMKKSLLKEEVGTIALAPRIASFSENLLLAIWDLLSGLDDDREMDCYPGWLLASDGKSFKRLIAQSINSRPLASSEIRPFAISQVISSRETRSLQKSGILRKHFRGSGMETPILALYGQGASQAPKLPGEKVWNLSIPSRGQFIRELPEEPGKALQACNLLIMHGHGIPGMSCSLDVQGLPSRMDGKIVLSGSCFSAFPAHSDLPPPGRVPGGYEVKQREAFLLRAVNNGALVSFGHQRLSSGFPHLYPVLESWLSGETVGEGYQRLLNALILKSGIRTNEFVISEQERGNRRLRQNQLLYVVIGDPALKPFQGQAIKTGQNRDPD